MSRFSPTIVDHFTNPRHPGELEDPDVRAFVGNPVCGDQVLLTANVDGEVVSEVRFRAFGCAASLAMASAVSEAMLNRGIDELANWELERIEQLLGGLAPDQRHVATLGADVVARLVHNFKNESSDDAPSTCC